MTIPLADLQAQYQSIKAEIDRAVLEALASARFVKGPYVKAFEEKFAAYAAAAHAVGVANGTDAIALALQAVGVEPGDEVVLPANTFQATAEAVWMIGAKVVLADVNEDTLLLDEATLSAALTGATKAVIPVHLYGYLAPMDELLVVAAKTGLPVIEDAAQAHGAKWHGRHAGTLGLVGAFSLFPGKVLGAYGDGGIVITDREDIAGRVRQLGDHGRGASTGACGRNSRLDGIQAAILSVKLGYLDRWAERRRAIDARYREALTGEGDLVFLTRNEGCEPVPLNVVIRSARRDELMKHLEESGVQAKPHYPQALHQMGIVALAHYAPGDFPVAERAAARVLSLPNYPEMTDEQVDFVIDRIKRFFAGA